jgi:hypothetical protein
MYPMLANFITSSGVWMNKGSCFCSSVNTCKHLGQNKIRQPTVSHHINKHPTEIKRHLPSPRPSTKEPERRRMIPGIIRDSETICQTHYMLTYFSIITGQQS